MKKNENNIIKELRSLKSIAPDSEWKKSNKHLLLSNAKGAAPKPLGRIRVGISAIFSIAKDVSLQPATMVLAMFVFIMSSSLMVNAAFYSLPGDALYPLKIRLEKTQLALVRNESARTELKVEFARKRVYEIDKILVSEEMPEKKAKKVNLAVNTLKKNMQSVKEEIENITRERGENFQIAISLSEASSDLEKSVSKGAGSITDEVKAALEETINSTIDVEISALMHSVAQGELEKAENASETAPTSTTPEADIVLDSEDDKALSEFLAKKLQDLSARFEEAIIAAEEKELVVDEIEGSGAETITKIGQDLEEKKYDDALAGLQELREAISTLKEMAEEAEKTLMESQQEDKPQVLGVDTAEEGVNASTTEEEDLGTSEPAE